MCTERKATGEYVLACFMFATMVAAHIRSAYEPVSSVKYKLAYTCSEGLKSLFASAHPDQSLGFHVKKRWTLGPIASAPSDQSLRWAHLPTCTLRWIPAGIRVKSRVPSRIILY